MAGWIIALIISVSVYAVLMAYVFPCVLLKTEAAVRPPRDRGIKNVKETTGRTIVYQPALEYRKYLPQYLLSERRGEKVLLCKLASNVKYIDYDVVTYDGMNRKCKVINAKELIDNEGYTELMPLDDEVAYVSVVVNTVNDQTLTVKRRKPVTVGKIVGYSLACLCTTFLEIFMIKVCCSGMFGGIFKESFMMEGDSVWLTIGIALAAVAVNLTFVLLAIGKNNRWNLKRGEE